MSIYLRIALIVFSLVTAVFTLLKVRKSKMRIEDSLFWICCSIVLVVISVFPQIPTFFSRLLGVQSPSNFIFLCMIFVLLLKVFTQSLKLSETENRLNDLIIRYGVDKAQKKEADD